MNQLFAGLFAQSTSQACVSDFTPPTFAGIATLVPRSNGSLRATWPAATDASSPVRYNIYIQAATATGLFSAVNRVLSTEKLTSDIFQDGAGVLLLSFSQGGPTYYVGVRAVDAIGNEEFNTVSLSANSTGVIPDNFNAIANELDILLASLAASVSAVLPTIKPNIQAVISSRETSQEVGAPQVVATVESEEIIT